MKEWRLNRLQGRAGFSFRQMDICDSSIWKKLSEDGPFDAVVNLAARAGVRQSLESPEIYVDTNVKGALNLLEFSRRHAVKKFIQASSSSVYGANEVRPYREDEDATRPLSYHYRKLGPFVTGFFEAFGCAYRKLRLVLQRFPPKPVTMLQALFFAKLPRLSFVLEVADS